MSESWPLQKKSPPYFEVYIHVKGYEWQFYMKREVKMGWNQSSYENESFKL